MDFPLVIFFLLEAVVTQWHIYVTVNGCGLDSHSHKYKQKYFHFPDLARLRGTEATI